MNSLVSVVIPTYKRKDRLKEALYSILNQTYKNIEIIIVDDNVDSEYSNYIRNLLQSLNNSKIKYLKNRSNLGGALSRNEGIKKAKGQFIAFLDDDDKYTKDSIQKKLKKMISENNSKLALVYGWVESRDDYGRVLHTYKYKKKGNCLSAAMYDCIAATSQWLCTKDSLLNVGMFSNVPSQQDSDLILKLIEHGYEVNYVPEILNYYSVHDGERISSGGLNKLKGMTLFRDKVRRDYKYISNSEAKQIELHHSKQILQLALLNKKYSFAYRESKKIFKDAPGFVLKKWIKNFGIK